MDISNGMLSEARRRLQQDPTLLSAITSNNVKVNFVQGDVTTQLVEKFLNRGGGGGGVDDGSSSSSSSSRGGSSSTSINDSSTILFDTVVDSFSLCVMGTDGAKSCLNQISQVVKPVTGQVLLLENTKSSNGLLGWYQDVTASDAARMGGKGCVYNQDVQSMIGESAPELRIVKERQYAAGLFRAFECRRVVG
jgi:hypothetical protein